MRCALNIITLLVFASVASVSVGRAATLPVVGSGTLKLHLVADSATTDANGVNYWPDQSGNGNDFDDTGAASQQPQKIAGIFNGHAVVDFDDSDFLNVIGGHNLNGAGLNAAFTLFAVTRDTTVPDALFDSAPGSPNVVRFVDGSFGPTQTFELWPGDPSVSVVPVATGSVLAIRGNDSRFLETQERHYASSTTNSATGSNTTLAWTNPSIGTINQGGNGFFDGQLAELVIYEGMLSAADRDLVTRSLLDFYAIPEPTSGCLALLGLAGLRLFRRRK